MSLLNKTNSVLNLLNTNEDTNYLYDYPDSDIKIYDNIHNYQSTNISSIQNSNITKIKEDNTNINLYNNKLQSNTENNIYLDSNIFPPKICSFPKLNSNEIYKNSINNNYSNFNVSQVLNNNNEIYTKIIEENNILKDKLISINREQKTNKNELDHQLLIIRDENTKLQLEIQRLIEKEKISYNKYQSELEEKNKIINDLKTKINSLSNENISLLNNIQNLNNKIISLTNDKQYLIEEMSELNKSLNNKIKPKLMKNEDYLMSLEQQIILLKRDNDILKDNGKRQTNLINNMQKENQLLKDTIDKYSSLQTIEDFTALNNIICDGKKKNEINNKKFASCKILYHENSKKNGMNGKSAKINSLNKRRKQCISEKNFDISNHNNNMKRKSYNYNYKSKNDKNYYNEKRNKSNGNNTRNSYKNNNNISKAKNKVLYYNTIIRKKDVRNFNNNKVNNDTFYKTRLKIRNNRFKIKLKNIDDINNKENNLVYNINNLSDSRSLLSSYSEELFL